MPWSSFPNSGFGSANIADNTLTAADLATDSVDAAEIKAGAVGTSELASAVGNFGVWTSYTMNWRGATTDPVLGNGTKSAYYCQIGKTVFGRANVNCGSGTTYGSNYYYFSLPVTSASTYQNQDIIGRAYFLDVGVAEYALDIKWNTSSSFVVSGFSPTYPINPLGSGDRFSFKFSYEAA